MPKIKLPNNPKVINTATFASKRNLLKLNFLLKILKITRYPSPPKIIKKAIIRFNQISFWNEIREVVPNKSNPALLNALIEVKTEYPTSAKLFPPPISLCKK